MFNNYLKCSLRVVSILVMLSLVSCNPGKEKVNFQVAKPSVLYTTITLHSKILNEDRQISIYVPVDTSYRKFPVMYLLDGEDKMDLVAGQMKYIDGEGPTQMMLPTIVVGIHNTDRSRDLTPTHVDESVSHMPGNTGGTDKFLQFINEELKPYIEKKYPTAPFTTFSGHSLGGLTVMYCMFKHPEMFTNYLAISPSLFWDNRLLVRLAKEVLKTNIDLHDKKLFFSDANEGASFDFHPSIVAVKAALDKYKPAGFTYEYKAYPNENHNTEPVPASYDAVKILYIPVAPKELSVTLGGYTIEQYKAHYYKLSAYYGFRIYPSVNANNILLSYILTEPNTEKLAAGIAEWNVQLYPKSADAWIALGDIYKQLKQTSKAADGYKKALALKPGDKVITKKLAEIAKA